MYSEKSFMAATGASSAPPQVSITGTGVTSISLEWDEVNCEDRNGEITSYSVRYEPSSSTPSQIAAAEGRALSIDGLLIHTSYSFRVAAVNGNGTGVYSSAVIRTTAVPTGVRH